MQDQERRVFDAMGDVLSKAHTEAAHCAFTFDHDRATRVEIGLLDLVTGILLEADILRHLVDDRDLAISVRALRKRRNPRLYEVWDRNARPIDTDDQQITLTTTETSTETRESDGFRAVVEATAEWAMTKTNEFEFTSWEPHSFPDGTARDLAHPFMAFFGASTTDASQQFVDSVIANGLSEDEARQIFQGMVNPPQRDDEWRRKLSARNFRYAVLRDLFERALGCCAT